MPYDVLTDLVRADNRLAPELSVEIDQRKDAVEAARATAEEGSGRPAGALVRSSGAA